ncbi:Protein of unknown function [Bacillus thuringiensis]|uniref:Uncharacterized protein n=2 Tax=Bacillus cereus group TaxID=86661 RepID=A0A1C4F7V1_BACTU|nr:Protein of unknown function [Bacillus thuringiensis]
MTPEPAIETIT